ncbi:MAG TPA: 3-hydroxyacyl-CoA dehydrogenase [Capillimicrobium sp.]|nr:3-hydroxyacyl-CoA dehydrogenase [Capillimicrobium sp.]
MTAGVPAPIGVVGAGIMGAGIAQLAAQAGARTVLYDPDATALDRGRSRIEQALARRVAGGRLDRSEADRIVARVEPATELEALADCRLVVEAAPERLDLKREILGALAATVSPDCVIASNTSSLSITELAATVARPERVVGLHFFNPAPVMRLVEVVAGEASEAWALDAAREVGRAMGKHVIDAADVPGFVVNRCNRPFFLESLTVLAERIATVEQIDRIATLGGGFRMGPFELMDLVGLDTNHAVAESFHRQSFGEPRFRPSPLQARLVAAGRLGRKTGRGWYSYDGDGGPVRHEPPVRERGGGAGRLVVVAGDVPLAREIRAAATEAGWDARASSAGSDGEPWLTIDCAPTPVSSPGPRARLLHAGSLHRTDPEAAGFHLLPPLDGVRLVETTTTPLTTAEAEQRTEELFASLGLATERVGDGAGLVLGRVVAQLINEAAYLIGEGNATPGDVDAGMTLGVNHPRGPVAWSEAIGLEHVVAILDGLHAELGDPRYRVAPLLRRSVALGTGLAVGAPCAMTTG